MARDDKVGEYRDAVRPRTENLANAFFQSYEVFQPTFRTLAAHYLAGRRTVARLLAWTVDCGRY
jgi:hypothetical protein